MKGLQQAGAAMDQDCHWAHWRSESAALLEVLGPVAYHRAAAQAGEANRLADHALADDVCVATGSLGLAYVLCEC